MQNLRAIVLRKNFSQEAIHQFCICFEYITKLGFVNSFFKQIEDLYNKKEAPQFINAKSPNETSKNETAYASKK